MPVYSAVTGMILTCYAICQFKKIILLRHRYNEVKNMNLDKLLKRVEHNCVEPAQKTYPLTIGGEEFQVKTMTRKRKRDFLYMTTLNNQNITIGEIVEHSKPYIYEALNLAPLAERAKQNKLIVKYYDIIEALFEPDEIIQIIAFITDINEITPQNAEKIINDRLDEIKKQ